jgi:hypothetical protein
MWTLDHLTLVTLSTALAVVLLAWGGFVLVIKCPPNHRRAGYLVNITASITAAAICAVGLSHLWTARRELDRRVWTARHDHLRQLQLLLGREARSLSGLSHALGERRYFTLVANDARQAIWQDEALTADVEEHFPEYVREREALIRRVLDYDREMGHVRQLVSASLRLDDGMERYRADLVPALVKKCAGAGAGLSLVQAAEDGPISHRSPTATDEPAVAASSAARRYDDYRCTPGLSAASRSLFDRADDLADAAQLLSETARRDAEDTVLHGSCTYAPAN